jgi:hypothetical protein
VTDSANAGATGANTGSANLYSGDATSTVGAASGSSGTANVYSGNSDDAASGDVNVYSGTAGTNSGSVRITTGVAGATRGDIVMTAAAVRIPIDNVSFRVGSTQMVEMRCNTGATTLHVDAVDPAADTTSYHVLMESGAVSSVSGLRTSGNLTLRTGTSTANGNNGGTSGAWVGGSGGTTATTAHVAGATGPVSLYSGSSTAGGGTSGASGSADFGSGDSASSTSGPVTVESGTAGRTRAT